ncbi:DNA binding protein [Rhodococcus phage Finch]|uniref:DUF7229 domain-containing protein n=1 Tax=Rhodococcus phage Finch TaxID=2094144 RepID=A0A2P1JXF7_9CAUD|nr:DNA binding protein [Rhodococcus phage Finch]AVO25003.1 hypothetical protein SEA_FINCH_64 [Rhodococcus phage Finch]
MPTDYNVEAVLRAAGVEVYYSTSDVAKMFGKTRQWVQWQISEGRVLGKDGEPVDFKLSPRGRRMWTADNVKDLAILCYNQRLIDMDGLKKIIRKLLKDSSAVNRKF